MHALPEDIARYKGVFDGGFQKIRAARFARLKEVGLIRKDLKLSPQSDDWEKAPKKEWDIRNMEVYAYTSMLRMSHSFLGAFSQSSDCGDNFRSLRINPTSFSRANRAARIF